MKNLLLTIAIIVLLTSIGYTQNNTSTGNNKRTIRPDTSFIELKNREILVIRNPIQRMSDRPKDTTLFPKKKKNGFRGTWTGLEFGNNNYLSNNRSFSLPADAKLLELKTFSSYQFNWNILKKSFGLYKDNLGIVTGLGLSFNNYSFSKQVIFFKDSIPIKFALDTTRKLDKNKLAITYLTLPLILEYHQPLGKSKIFISTGIIGSLKLKSKIKQKDENGNKYVYPDDYQLSPFKLEGTLRIGYGKFHLYTNYSLTTLFKNNKGPQLYPISLGLGLAF